MNERALWSLGLRKLIKRIKIKKIVLRKMKMLKPIPSTRSQPSIELTLKVGCSVRCAYCPQDLLLRSYKGKGRPTEMTMDIFSKCLNNIPPEVKLIFNGMCEPWLNPHCADMLLYAHKAKYEIEMSTTLIGMTMEDLAKIRHIPLQPLFIHVPSNDNDMQITIDDEYLTLLKTVINTMVCEPNVLYFKEIHPAIEPLILKVKKKGKFWDLHNRACHLDSKIKRKRRLKSCNRLQIGVLMPSGEVVLCCNDYAMQHVLGNLTKQSWDSLYKGEVFQQVISGWNNPSSDLLCWQCWDGCNN